MSEQKHSAGPWEVEEPCTNSLAIVDAAGGNVAELVSDGDEIVPIMRANANLIATAPDLLAALLQWQRAQTDRNAVEMVNAQIARDAAITKATGSQP